MTAGIDLRQFRIFVVEPTLTKLGMWSPSAVNLLLGTAAHESHGMYLDQILGSRDTTLGPAVGLYQIEPATESDVWNNYLRYRSRLAGTVSSLLAPWPGRSTQLATNLTYATAMARLIYRRVPAPLPAHDDVRALAKYWKKYYNTYKGKGTEQAFIDKYTENWRDMIQ